MKSSLSVKILAVLVSGIFYYFGFGMDGSRGWLMWIAPAPILFISLQVNAKQAFGLAFLTYLIGRLSWLPYLISVLPAPLAVLFTCLPSLIFALTVVASRRMVLISPHWISALAFPFLVTAFEYILFLLSKDGTMTSIAYTQSNYLPEIQIASITGILGISFLIAFVPSALVMIWYFKNHRKTANVLAFLVFLVVADVFIYGWIRLRNPAYGKETVVGMAVIDESVYRQPNNSTDDLYLNAISKLASQGAQVIMIPEKAITVSDSTGDATLKRFSELAAQKKVQLVIGGARQKTGYWLNNAWVFSDSGKLTADYQKVNLFAGEEMDHCKPGSGISIFSVNKMNEGVAICKDMDFQHYILGYSKKSPAILYVPAWDFRIDGWLHSRMAILRSVEGGFSLARNAREGRLTLSDWRGKIIAETSSESGGQTSLLGKLTILPHPTTYARAGDWFGTVSLFVAFGFLIFLFKNRKLKNVVAE